MIPIGSLAAVVYVGYIIMNPSMTRWVILICALAALCVGYIIMNPPLTRWVFSRLAHRRRAQHVHRKRRQPVLSEVVAARYVPERVSGMRSRGPRENSANRVAQRQR